MVNETSERSAAIVRDIYDAGATNDFDRMAGLLDEQITVASAPYLPWGGPWTGRDAFLYQCAPQLMAMYDLPNMVIEEVLADGDKGVAIIRTPVRDSDENVTNLEIWTIKDGKAVDLKVFCLDPRPLFAKLGWNLSQNASE